MATERQKTIVKKHKKSLESRGINRGYVVQGDDGVVRNARMEANRPQQFTIYANGKKYRISTGCSKLEMGSSHTCTSSTDQRTFMVLREI
jgi:hypothetical protein